MTDGTSSTNNTRLWTISEAGLAHWLRETNPAQAGQALADAVADCRQELAELGKRAAGCQQYLARLSSAVELTFTNRNATTPAATGTAVAENANATLECLQAWRDAGDCPLPVLFKNVQAVCPGLSSGAFHDALRLLSDRSAIHLHPWTGPLYELPEPTLALLSGHEIAYYASVREQDSLASLPAGERLG
jgi:hypothetical protein